MAFLLFLSMSAFAQNKTEAKKDNKINSQIMRLETELREATLKNDVAASDRLKADDWLNINPNGTTSTKAQTLELMRSNSFPFLSIEDTNVTVRLYDGAAVVTGESVRKFSGPNKTVLTRHVLFTRVWAKRGKTWLFVTAQATPIQPRPVNTRASN